MQGTSQTQASAGLSIRSTAIGRRASASYRVFDRVGGWWVVALRLDWKGWQTDSNCSLTWQALYCEGMGDRIRPSIPTSNDTHLAVRTCREILSACVDGVYMRVMNDPRIGPIQLNAEQTLKTTLVRGWGCVSGAVLDSQKGGSGRCWWWRCSPALGDVCCWHAYPQVEFLSAAFSGIHGRTASQSMWKKHQEIVHQLGLEPSYFDCLIEHFQVRRRHCPWLPVQGVLQWLPCLQLCRV